MHIGLEMRLVTLGGAGGIAMLLRGVLRSMFQRYPQHQFTCFNTVFNRGLLGEVPGNVELNTLPLGSYFQDVGRLCAEKKINVLFRGYPLEQHVDFPLDRQVVEIPDIQHEYFPEFFDAECLRSRRAAFGRVLAGAGAIGTISEFARQTLLEQLCTRCRDIFLMSPALQVEHQQYESLTDAEKALVPTGDYFLFPGNLWKHKNHERVLRAFQGLLQSYREPVQFLFTGHPHGWEPFQQRFGHLPIRHLGFVRPALLRRLLEGARALVFFSLYEGFGMPLLEAFDAGTPVLCSNTTSLAEVGGDAVLSCDPTDIQAMRTLMAVILKQPELRPGLVERGRNRLQCYTWEQSADNLMAACERVAARAEAARQPQLHRIAVTQWPRVALVTPSFNQGRFLRRTIDSVLAQNYPHLEYLVVDGGSTDDSLDVLRSYGNRVRWISEPDQGQSQALNKGFARVQGEIRAYLNSDDTLLPGAIEKAVNHFVVHPECDMVYGKAHLVDEDDRVLGDYETGEYSFERLLQQGCYICQPAAFWRTRIADKVGPFDETLHLSLDFDYWQRIDRAGGRIDHLPQHLACARLHPAAKTLSRRVAVFDEAIRVCRKNAGSAALVYYQGLWHHRCHDAGRGRWLLRRIPYLPQVMSRLHHRWANRATYGTLDLARETARTVKKRFGPRVKVLLTHARSLTKLLGSELAPPLAMVGPKAVDGFWGDNWLSARCIIRLKDSPAGEHLQLIGVATEPMELTVSVQDKPLGIFPLRGQAMEEVRFHVGPGAGRELTLKFSKHMIDAANRPLAFLLHGTNLFTEQDLAG
jgi:glycosyltransferase involved in cell wall biosynthesis